MRHARAKSRLAKGKHVHPLLQPPSKQAVALCAVLRAACGATRPATLLPLTSSSSLSSSEDSSSLLLSAFLALPSAARLVPCLPLSAGREQVGGREQEGQGCKVKGGGGQGSGWEAAEGAESGHNECSEGKVGRVRWEGGRRGKQDAVLRLWVVI